MLPRKTRPSLVRAGSSLSDTVLVIATALNKEGICAVLTGDAAVAIHTGALAGDRLNYTLTSPAASGRLASAMHQLGFEPMNAGTYRHVDTGVALDLSQAPLALGRDDHVIAQTLHLRHGYVRILSPTDCCREQLLRWRETGDDRGMASAVSLAKHCPIDMPVMRGWMRKERLQGSWAGFKRSVAGTLTHLR
jgi:hypothetical protein